MNLYTEAGGLFGTHVTWSDIEGDMQRELNTTASFGPNKSAKDIGECSIYHMKKFTDSNPLKGYIIMEYIENIVSVHFYEILTPAEVEQVYIFKILRNKAVLEATTLNFTSEEKKQLAESSFEEYYAAFFSTEAVELVMAAFRNFESGRFREKAFRLEKIVSDLSDLSRVDSLSEECATLSTLSTVIKCRNPG
ncbi:unnamed protein product [Haemonchus placei]|uniref:RGS domain-containing protein n=1 Tax=Haemonchus placei TaxID=6290 RepID=A0A0N4W7B3_HAEPC|nr:unnamed protein product [Haemonchus placei]